mmetsp:Transcript_105191/g.327955  ORF Transcript_105191/g.327955 Transcript_105191/m.327955 type:complete len:395 (-) Transcript_105191:9-1193(-)
MPLDEATQKALTNALYELEDEHYMVDNTYLNSSSRGIRYRKSPTLDDLDKEPGGIVKFGTIVEGISFPSDWLLVNGFGKRRFLPKKMQGAPVLMRIEVGQGNRAYFDDSDDEWAKEPAPPPQASPTSGGAGADQHEPRDAGRPRRQPPPRAAERAAKDRVRLTAEEQQLCEVADVAINSRPALVEHLVRLRCILESYPRSSSLDVCGEDGHTPVMLAARRGNLDFCVVLVAAGAKGDATTPEGHNAADIASWKPCRALIRALVGDGFDTLELRSALDKLQPEQKRVAEDLIRRGLMSQIGGSTPEAKAPENSSPQIGGGGVLYRVGFNHIVVFESPSSSSEELCELTKGDTIEAFGYDNSRCWARVKIQLPHGFETGWVQLQNAVLGAILTPVK